MIARLLPACSVTVMRTSVLASTSLLVLSLSACQSLPKVLGKTYAPTSLSATQNLLPTGSLSTATTALLIAAGQEETTCMANFERCHQLVSETFFEDGKSKLVTLAELHYRHSQYLRSQSACRNLQRAPIDPKYANAPVPIAEQQAQAIAKDACLAQLRHALFATLTHSYAYVFFDQLTGQHTKLPVIQEADIRAQDLYHMSVNDLISELQKPERGAFVHGNFVYNARPTPNHVAQHRLMGIHHEHTHLHIHLANEPDYLLGLGTADTLPQITSWQNSHLAPLDTVSQRSGLGVSFVASQPDRYTATVKDYLKARLSLASDSSAQDTSPISDIHVSGVHMFGARARTESIPSDLLDGSPSADIGSRIHPMPHLLLTAVIVPRGRTLLEVLDAKSFDVYLFNPHRTHSIRLLGNDYPLAANFSAGYATWLAENQFDKLGMITLLAKQDAQLPRLFMLEPYQPNKRVIIMLHGLASSPRTWVNLTNTLFADPALREHYQVWQVFYATNLPILENRYHIQTLIDNTYHINDPSQSHAASRHSVLIGHSMGGIISRMMLSQDNLLATLQTLSKHDQNRLMPHTSPTQGHTMNQAQLASLIAHDPNLVHERLQLSPLTQVDTAVFISAPFRGTDYADRWFTRAIRRVIHLPIDLTGAAAQTVLGLASPKALGETLVGGLYLQNGASQLSDQSSFIKLTQDIQIADGIRYHSIMGNNESTRAPKHPLTSPVYQPSTPQDKSSDPYGSTPNASPHTHKHPDHHTQHLDLATLSDGIVPYTSSHLAGAASEHIILGGHSIHERPETILHLRQILRDHQTANPILIHQDDPHASFVIE